MFIVIAYSRSLLCLLRRSIFTRTHICACVCFTCFFWYPYSALITLYYCTLTLLNYDVVWVLQIVIIHTARSYFKPMYAPFSSCEPTTFLLRIYKYIVASFVHVVVARNRRRNTLLIVLLLTTKVCHQTSFVGNLHQLINSVSI